MKAVTSDRHQGHDPKRFILRGKFAPGEERPERAERLLAGLKQGHHTLVSPEAFGQGPRLGVHAVDYLHFLEEAATEWQSLADASDEVLGNVHPVRRQGTTPRVRHQSAPMRSISRASGGRAVIVQSGASPSPGSAAPARVRRRRCPGRRRSGAGCR